VRDSAIESARGVASIAQGISMNAFVSHENRHQFLAIGLIGGAIFLALCVAAVIA
jgi:hypothetical protein